MAYLENLIAASFRGVPFFVSSEGSQDLGRRVAIHDYVNSNERYVEDLGELPQSFKVDAFVSGSNWAEQQVALEKALREEGPGALFLPTLGKFTVYAQPYSIDISQQSIGIVTFNLAFTRGKVTAGPTEAEPDSATVYRNGDLAREELLMNFDGYFNVPTELVSIQAFASDVVSSVDDTIGAIKSYLSLDGLAMVLKAASGVKTYIGQLIRSPLSLAQGLLRVPTSLLSSGFWPSVSQALSMLSGKSLSGAFSSLLGLTRWGNNLTTTKTGGTYGYAKTFSSSDGWGIATWPSTTQTRVLRNENRENFARFTRLNALVTAYEVAAAREYSTENDVYATRTQIEDAYSAIMTVDMDKQNAIQASQPIRSAVDAVRISSLSVMNRASVTSWKVGSEDLSMPRPSLALSHALYAEKDLSPAAVEERVAVIRALNPDKPSQALSGTVKVLQSD